MEIHVTGEELYFAAIIAGERGIPGVEAPPGIDTPEKIDKQAHVVGKTLYQKGIVTENKKKYVISPPIAPLIQTAARSDLMWIVKVGNATTYYYITPDVVVEISGTPVAHAVRDFADLQDVYNRIYEVFGVPNYPDAQLEFAADQKSLNHLNGLIQSGKGADAVPLLVQNGLAQEDAQNFINTQMTAIRTLNIVAVNNRQNVSRNFDIVSSQGCNIIMEPCEDELIKISSFDFDKLIAKLTWAQ